MIYSPSKGVLFTNVSRTGGTTISSLLKKQLPDCQIIGNQHSPLAEARVFLGSFFEKTYKFSIVRNPWERFVSWYALIGQSKNDDKLGYKHFSNPRTHIGKILTVFLKVGQNRRFKSVVLRVRPYVSGIN